VRERNLADALLRALARKQLANGGRASAVTGTVCRCRSRAHRRSPRHTECAASDHHVYNCIDRHRLRACRVATPANAAAGGLVLKQTTTTCYGLTGRSLNNTHAWRASPRRTTTCRRTSHTPATRSARAADGYSAPLATLTGCHALHVLVNGRPWTPWVAVGGPTQQTGPSRPRGSQNAVMT